MYKRKLNQTTMFEDPAMFGGIALNPENDWVKMAKLIPWWAFEEKYAEQFPSKTGQPADSFRMALAPWRRSGAPSQVPRSARRGTFPKSAAAPPHTQRHAKDPRRRGRDYDSDN